MFRQNTIKSTKWATNSRRSASTGPPSSQFTSIRWRWRSWSLCWSVLRRWSLGGCTCFRSAGRAPGACPWFPSAGGAPQQVLPHLQTEAPLEDLLAPPQTLESLVTVLASPLRQRSPGDCACSRSDGGVAGDSVCCDVARRSPESFCGGGALGDRGAASPEAALHDFVSFPLYCLYSSLPFTGLGRNGGLFFYTMHLMFYTVPYIVQLLTLLAWLLLAFCCRFATELWPPSVDLSKKFFHRGCYARSLQ